MRVYFYRIYKDTQLQNMVDQTVENGDMMGTLQKMSNYDSRIKDIIENQDQYPKELLELLTANIETIEFVFDYPEKKDNLPATIVEEAKSGEIPLLLQWDERWGSATGLTSSTTALYGNSLNGTSGGTDTGIIPPCRLHFKS